jgi:hypothetical protein
VLTSGLGHEATITADLQTRPIHLKARQVLFLGLRASFGVPTTTTAATGFVPTPAAASGAGAMDGQVLELTPSDLLIGGPALPADRGAVQTDPQQTMPGSGIDRLTLSPLGRLAQQACCLWRCLFSLDDGRGPWPKALMASCVGTATRSYLRLTNQQRLQRSLGKQAPPAPNVFCPHSING